MCTLNIITETYVSSNIQSNYAHHNSISYILTFYVTMNLSVIGDLSNIFSLDFFH